MKYVFLLLTVFASVTMYAQDCNQEELDAKPGYWKPGMKGSTSNVSAADLGKEKAVLASIHKMISLGYTPKGCQATYTNAFSGANPNAGKNWIADSYYYSIYVLRFLCDPSSADKSKWYVNISTATVAYIQVNTLDQLNNLYAAELPDDQMRGYLILEKRPVLENGFYSWGKVIVGDSHLPNPIVEYRALITYDEKLPYRELTRKEFLLLSKKRLEKTMSENSGSHYFDKFMENINEQLGKPTSYLDQPAICRRSDEEQFTGFVQEGSQGSFIPVVPNPDYYRHKLGKSVPQFFSVTYKIATGLPAEVANMEAIQKAVDFNKLRNMLGKEAITGTTPKP